MLNLSRWRKTAAAAAAATVVVVPSRCSEILVQAAVAMVIWNEIGLHTDR